MIVEKARSAVVISGAYFYTQVAAKKRPPCNPVSGAALAVFSCVYLTPALLPLSVVMLLNDGQDDGKHKERRRQIAQGE